jgi:2'-5' RNA ligase
VPVQSVELLLDDPAEDLVLAVWQRLLQAGLPSQARHRSPSNRPHITLVALPGLPDGADPRLATAAAGVPVDGRWGAVTAFGRGPWTVVWLVDTSAAMRALHQRVADVCAVPEDHLTAAGHWTPHVTLARRVTEADLDSVLHLVAGPIREATGTTVTAAAVRRWDGAARADWLVSGTARTSGPQP